MSQVFYDMPTYNLKGIKKIYEKHNGSIENYIQVNNKLIFIFIE